MATAPQTDALQNVLAIDPAAVEVGPRIGLFWPDKAAALGKLLATDGQRTPISVRRNSAKAKLPYLLVAGYHRLEGAKLEYLRSIDAIEVYGDDRELREIEASENLHRRSFAPIERACFVSAIADAAEQRMAGQHEGLSQQQIAIKARWAEAKAKVAGVNRANELDDAEAEDTRLNLSRVYGWRDEIAAAMDLSLAAIKRDLSLHRAIVAPFPDLYRSLAGHSAIADNASALREISAVKDVPARGKLIQFLIENPELSVAEAKEKIGLREAQPPAATGATKYLNNATSNLERLTATQQRDAAPAIVAGIKPTALLALRDALNARIAAEGVA